jgi:formate/nitrite transporter FocA (FNT family)
MDRGHGRAAKQRAFEPVAASNNLFWVTLGNMTGGMMVGVTYWFIYLRKPG